MRVYDFSELKQIAFELRNNKAAIIETDTVMGIVSFDEQLIYKIKKRNQSKKIVLLVGDISEVPFLSENEKKVLEKFWPGSLTIVKNKKSYRMPKHNELRMLIDMVGPIYCSSANISNTTVIDDWTEVKSEFKSNPTDLVVVKGKSLTKIPSTVYDFDEQKIIRDGIISEQEIIQILK